MIRPFKSRRQAAIRRRLKSVSSPPTFCRILKLFKKKKKKKKKKFNYFLKDWDSSRSATRGLTAYIAPLRFYRSLQIK